eukprot:scaffold1264_cov540-Prasinococcus_capsulatus_cf.AAC.1
MRLEVERTDTPDCASAVSCYQVLGQPPSCLCRRVRVQVSSDGARSWSRRDQLWGARTLSTLPLFSKMSRK